MKSMNLFLTNVVIVFVLTFSGRCDRYRDRKTTDLTSPTTQDLNQVNCLN